METRVGEYVWPHWDSRRQIPPIFNEPFKLHTAKAAIFQGLLMAAFMVLAVNFKVTQTHLDGRCSNLTVLLFTQVALWAISLIIHHYFSRHHNFLRGAGYNLFPTSFNQKSSQLFSVLTCCNAFTLLQVAASVKYAPSSICEWDLPYSALNLTVYSILVEGVLFLVATSGYVRNRYVASFWAGVCLTVKSNICAVMVFNRMSPIPEVIAAQAMSPNESFLEEANEMLIRHVREQSFIIDFYKRCLSQLSINMDLIGLMQTQYQNDQNIREIIATEPF